LCTLFETKNKRDQNTSFLQEKTPMRNSTQKHLLSFLGMLLVMSAAAIGISAQSSADEMFRAQLIPRGSKIFIATFRNEAQQEGKTPAGFESYVAAALRKKGVPLLIVSDPHDADFVIEGTADKKGAGWAKKIFAGDYRSSVSASMTVTNTKTNIVVYADASDRSSANRGYRSSAEKLAKYLKRKIEDDEKKLAKMPKA
jgi:hypothetical protein